MKKTISILFLFTILFSITPNTISAGDDPPLYPYIIPNGDTFVSDTAASKLFNILASNACTNGYSFGSNGGPSSFECSYGDAGNVEVIAPMMRTWTPMPEYGVLRIPAVVPYDFDLDTMKLGMSNGTEVYISYWRENGYGKWVEDKIMLRNFHVDVVISSTQLDLIDYNTKIFADSMHLVCDQNNVEVRTSDNVKVDYLSGDPPYEWVINYSIGENTGGVDYGLPLYIMEELQEWMDGKKIQSYEEFIVDGGSEKGSFTEDERTLETIWLKALDDNLIPSSVTGFEDVSYFEKFANEPAKYPTENEYILRGVEKLVAYNIDSFINLDGACPSFFAFTPVMTSAHTQSDESYNGQIAYEFVFNNSWYFYVRPKWTDILFYNENYDTCRIHATALHEKDMIIFERAYRRWQYEDKKWKEQKANYDDYELAVAFGQRGLEVVNDPGERPEEPSPPEDKIEYLKKCGIDWENLTLQPGGPTDSINYYGQEGADWRVGSWQVFKHEFESAHILDMREDAPSGEAAGFFYPVYQAQPILIDN